MITILGAGLAGLSCSFHLGHEKCVLFERNRYVGGHIYSHRRDGFVWDEGPHVSFTKHPYVRDFFAESVQDELLEYPVQVSNYFRGHWIPHPAQSNLFAVPEPYRTACLDSFLKNPFRDSDNELPTNYAEWLYQAFGSVFTNTFPAVYTAKYWTRSPHELATDWIGQRVFLPNVDRVLQGFHGPAAEPTHYITTVRYPSRGGFFQFASKLCDGAQVYCQHSVERIDLKKRIIFFSNGQKHHYEKLINTLPLPKFIEYATNVPPRVLEAARSLCCTSLLLVNVTAPHPARQPYHWLYVYDDDKLSTRINHIELLSPHNAPSGKTGIQVEIYASRYKPLPATPSEIAQQIQNELIEMGLIEIAESVHTRFIPFANVVFDHQRRDAQDLVLNWLRNFGLQREDDDLDPMTNWDRTADLKSSQLALAGRFGQWKYYWSDDCLMRGRHLGANWN